MYGDPLSVLYSQMLINLASLSVLPQQPPEDSLPSHPQDFGRHPSFVGTLSLSDTSMTSFTFGSEQSPSARTRVHRSGLDDDTAIFDQLANVGSAVRVSNFILF